MTLLERKAQLARIILSDIDEATLDELEAVYTLRSGGKKTPCQHTKEELNTRALQAIEDVEEGRVTRRNPASIRKTV